MQLPLAVLAGAIAPRKQCSGCDFNVVTFRLGFRCLHQVGHLGVEGTKPRSTARNRLYASDRCGDLAVLYLHGVPDLLPGREASRTCRCLLPCPLVVPTPPARKPAPA